jgi:hypothetical protein
LQERLLLLTYWLSLEVVAVDTTVVAAVVRVDTVHRLQLL